MALVSRGLVVRQARSSASRGELPNEANTRPASTRRHRSTASTLAHSFALASSSWIVLSRAERAVRRNGLVAPANASRSSATFWRDFGGSGVPRSTPELARHACVLQAVLREMVGLFLHLLRDPPATQPTARSGRISLKELLRGSRTRLSKFRFDQRPEADVCLDFTWICDSSTVGGPPLFALSRSPSSAGGWTLPHGLERVSKLLSCNLDRRPGSVGQSRR